MLDFAKFLFWKGAPVCPLDPEFGAPWNYRP